MTAPAPELIRGEGLTRRFADVTALLDVDVALSADEIVAVAGPSGSGKTTLLAVLGGLDEPTSGRVAMAGTDVYALRGAARARLRAANVGFVFQTHNLLATLTAEENVTLAVQHGARPAADPRAVAREVLARLGLDAARGRLPRALSLGEQQRVAIARALAAGPPVIIADEPTASLDGKSGRTVLDALRTAAHGGCAVLLASHDERCLAIADRVLHVLDGRLVTAG
jgi:putative ABC transport system ATP-binding protein